MLCPLGVKISAHDVDWIRTQRMEAFLAVARGSCEDPYFLEATWEGPDSKNRPPVLLAAKGVTFDRQVFLYWLPRSVSLVRRSG